MRTLASLALAASLVSPPVVQTETVRLWDGPPPLPLPLENAERELPFESGQNPDIVRLANVSEPSLTVYHPPADKRTGTCVLICPGGGYRILAMKHEGTQVAQWLNSLGVTAVVLKYRVPSPKGEPPQVRPLLDAQRAVSIIRGRAMDWEVAPDRIGVLGFSAGGHLAAWLLCEGNRRLKEYPHLEGEAPCRPDFGILIYPAYLAASDKNRPAPAIRGEEVPGPVFFVHANDDKLVPENSVEFYLALRKAGVPAEVHIYQRGGHGFGMLRNKQPINDWPERCADWLRSNGFIPAR